jgi:hypothetical protein
LTHGGDHYFGYSKTPPGQDEKYHDLALDVGPTEVRAWFDAVPFPPLNYRQAAELLEFSVRQTGLKLDAPPDFRQTGGIGLIVIRGSCSFRDVVVERAP